MYDELVKRLRVSVDGRYEKCDVCPYEEDYPCCVDCLDKMHKEAADAIEKLSKRVDESIPKDDAEIIIAEVAKPRWIPVKERLPEENGRYLVRYKRDIGLDYIEVHDDEVRIMRFFVDDGWRYPFLCQPELRKAEHQTVTHWMELPILPAEDNENG